MRRCFGAALLALAVVLPACGGDDKGDKPAEQSTPADASTAPEGSPSGSGQPATEEEAIDQIVDQIAAGVEASGGKIDRDCVKDLLSDAELRERSQTDPASATTAFLKCIELPNG
jgi:ABC-type glycerol-3-phosphate transport system substrate-binding protein